MIVMAMIICKRFVVMLLMMKFMIEVTIDKNPLRVLILDLEIFNRFDFCHCALLRSMIVPGIDDAGYCYLLRVFPLGI